MREKRSLPHTAQLRRPRLEVWPGMLSEATAPRPPSTASMEEAAEPDAHLVGPK